METTIYGHFALTPVQVRNLRKAIKALEKVVAQRKAEADAKEDIVARINAYAAVEEAEEMLAANEERLAAGLPR